MKDNRNDLPTHLPPANQATNCVAHLLMRMLVTGQGRTGVRGPGTEQRGRRGPPPAGAAPPHPQGRWPSLRSPGPDSQRWAGPRAHGRGQQGGRARTCLQGAAPCGVPARGPDDQLREMLAELPSGRSDKAALRKKTTEPSQPLTISSAQDTRSLHSRSEVSQHGVSWEQHRWGTHTDAPPPLPRGETHSIGAGRAMGRPSPVHARPGTPRPSL